METREQIAALLRNTKWIILASLVFSALLLLPDQIIELYRDIYSDAKISEIIRRLHIPVILIGLFVWFAANQIVVATHNSITAPTRSFHRFATVLPLLLACSL